jgi:hypothetical protein
MNYVYTYLIPILILVISYFTINRKPQKASEWVNLILKALPYEFGYMFFVYYLDKEQHIDTGWSFLSLITILLPIAAVAIILKICYWLRNIKPKQ